MCNDPAMRAPRNGCSGPTSSRVAIRPGISVSAIAISLRPHSARPMSLTTQSCWVNLALAAVGEVVMGDPLGRRTGHFLPLYNKTAGMLQRTYKDFFISILAVSQRLATHDHALDIIMHFK